MKKPYLIQRLTPPGKINPFAFGGGYRYGGLSPKFALEIEKIFTFDYMGSAEFEFGALADAMNKIYDNRRTYCVRETKCYGKPIYVICESFDWLDICSYIHSLARKEDRNLKEVSNFKAVLKNELPAGYSHKPIGWIELGNAFMWFLDGDTARQTALLFGISYE